MHRSLPICGQTAGTSSNAEPITLEVEFQLLYQELLESIRRNPTTTIKSDVITKFWMILKEEEEKVKGQDVTDASVGRQRHKKPSMLAAEKNNKRYKRDARLKKKGLKKTRRPKQSKNDIQGIGTKNSEERIKIRRKGANKNQRHNKINTCGKNRNTCNSNRIKTEKNKKKIKQIFKTKRIQKKGRLGQERTLKMNHQKFDEESKNCTSLWA